MKTAERQNNFNLIRIILALLVILGHSPEIIDGDRHRELLTRVFSSLSFGELAVDGFFLLSGYLIMQSWDAQPLAWPFLKKRLLRIYPGFIVAAAVCALVVGPLGATSAKYFASFETSEFIKSVLLLQIPAVPAVFEGQPYPNINGAMWTISREFCCYLLVLALGASGVLRVRHFWLGLTAVVFAAIVALKLTNVPILDLRLASFFLSGGCYYIYRDRIPMKGVAAVAAATVATLFMFSWRASELVLASIGGYALLYVASKRSALLSNFNRLPDVSYGVYLYGWPIQKLLFWHEPSMSPWALFAISASLAILAGTVSWYLIEKPALRFKGSSLQLPEPQPETMAQ
jgi:peptidoglycan/LPS O-acetylase OafA/YrhL